MSTSDIRRLLTIIEQQLDWGDAATWQSKDFEILNQLIFDKTKISLSASTLRRVWGRVEYKNLPSGTTLDTLAMFAGFENWRAFIRSNSHQGKNNAAARPIVKPAVDRPKFNSIIATTLVLAVILIGVYFTERPGPGINNNDYKFSSKRLTGSIPNSVIFNYDATAAPTDSIYIQQSWDPRTKTLVSKSLHQHTSVYYEPGFYQAKLVVGGKTVKQHKLMIPTNGWLGLIENRPVPVYLKPADFIGKDVMRLNTSREWIKNAALPLQVPFIKYYNVGNFVPVPLTDFSFSVRVKNEYSEGSAACQFAGVSLITDSGPIIIQLSTKGCVSELNMIDVNLIISGKNVDLSGFGVDFSDWALVSCKSAAGKIQYYVNNKLVYEAPMPSYKVKIVGMGFNFQGAGAVKNIELRSGDKIAFQAF